MMAAAIMDPLIAPQFWDTISAAGVFWSGLAKVSGFVRENDFDVKNAPGTEGATSTYRGNKLAEGKIVLYVWTSEHWAALVDFLPLFRFDPSAKSGQAIDIWHPSFDVLDPPLRAMVVKKIGVPERSKDGDSLYTVTIECLEYRPPKKKNATSTPKGSKDTAKGTADKIAEASAEDKYGAKIGQLLEQGKTALGG